MPPRRLTLVSLLVCLPGVAACGGGAAGLTPTPLPVEESAREPILFEVGRRLHALYAGAPEDRVLVDRAHLDAVLDPVAAARARRTPPVPGWAPDGVDRRLLGDADYLGVCVQGLRAETAGGPIGLREDGWVFDRALVVGRQPGNRRVAAWVEGIFVHTERGFRAIALRRLEHPRWEHADLDLAPCDMAAGGWGAQHVGMATP